jgi:hypothetical protein
MIARDIISHSILWMAKKKRFGSSRSCFKNKEAYRKFSELLQEEKKNDGSSLRFLKKETCRKFSEFLRKEACLKISEFLKKKSMLEVLGASSKRKEVCRKFSEFLKKRSVVVSSRSFLRKVACQKFSQLVQKEKKTDGSSRRF